MQTDHRWIARTYWKQKSEFWLPLSSVTPAFFQCRVFQ